MLLPPLQLCLNGQSSHRLECVGLDAVWHQWTRATEDHRRTASAQTPKYPKRQRHRSNQVRRATGVSPHRHFLSEKDSTHTRNDPNFLPVTTVPCTQAAHASLAQQRLVLCCSLGSRPRNYGSTLLLPLPCTKAQRPTLRTSSCRPLA